MFYCSSGNNSLHLKNIYEEQELEENRTTEYFSVVQKEGKRDVKVLRGTYGVELKIQAVQRGGFLH